MSRASFLTWARGALAPLPAIVSRLEAEALHPLGAMIGDASVVALSEASHNAAEPMEFRNRVLQYLVERHQFTAIAIESGLVESQVVHDFVRGGAGSLSQVVSEGISWTFDRHPQNHALVRWVREYNTNTRHVQKINFYGFDVPGSPGNTNVARSMDVALTKALQYLNLVDRQQADILQTRVESLLPSLRLDCHAPVHGSSYTKLELTQRNAITAVVADVISLFERSEERYIAASTRDSYAWAYRAAICARQADNWLRCTPKGWRPPNGAAHYSPEDIEFLSAASDVRDRAQADNLDWIIRQEGDHGKVLVYASRFHVCTTLFKTSRFQQRPAGTYLRQRFGDQLVTIGNLIGGGSHGDSDGRSILWRAAPESMDGIAREVGSPLYLLDLRKAPQPIMSWLLREHPLAPSESEVRLAIGHAFDVLFYIDTITPA